MKVYWNPDNAIFERTDAMRFDIRNWQDLKNAVIQMDTTAEPKVLVFDTPGGIFHRFIFNDHGVEKDDCDNTGRPIE